VNRPAYDPSWRGSDDVTGAPCWIIFDAAEGFTPAYAAVVAECADDAVWIAYEIAGARLGESESLTVCELDVSAVLDGSFDDMVGAYLLAVLWTGLAWPDGGEGEPVPLDSLYDVEDVDPACIAGVRSELAGFVRGAAADLCGMDAAQAGHDFLLTRDGHGVGFWDRGLGERGARLSDAARAYGESCVYVTPAGRVWVES
jgi:hypothetical protein